eukprot:gnl/Trimastix_PCT/2542.p1 GENE.gnl/Trimastix_PCT/2542~~gnl/Trimastix_PCT/2542.p1  ORF type:complete len:284 (+),score=41.52 gnl/Trimastix_PCT/2542:77-928(+)
MSLILTLFIICAILFVFFLLPKFLFYDSQSPTWSDHLCPHGTITQLAPRLYQVTGSLPHGPMPRNMVIYKLESGGTLIHSPICLYNEVQRAVENLGTPEIIIVPNRMHRLDAAVYKKRYSNARVLCPRVARTEVSKRVRVDGTCEDELPKIPGVTVHTSPNTMELVYELDINAGPRLVQNQPSAAALVCADTWFNLHHLPGLSGQLMKLFGSTGGFGVTGFGMFFLAIFRKRAAMAAFMRELVNRPAVQVEVISVAHGAHVSGEALCKHTMLCAADRVHKRGR